MILTTVVDVDVIPPAPLSPPTPGPAFPPAPAPALPPTSVPLAPPTPVGAPPAEHRALVFPSHTWSLPVEQAATASEETIATRASILKFEAEDRVNIKVQDVDRVGMNLSCARSPFNAPDSSVMLHISGPLRRRRPKWTTVTVESRAGLPIGKILMFAPLGYPFSPLAGEPGTIVAA